MRLVLALAALVFAAPAVAAATTPAKPVVLVGKVGKADAYTITLTKGGKQVTTLKHGRYTIVVHDYSAIHNFRLKGPGLNKWTTVPQVGDVTWKVNLRKGVYTVVCDPHAVAMTVKVRVT